MSGPNTVTPEQFAELKRRFHGKMTEAEAIETIRAAMKDDSLPPIVRINAAPALLEIRSGRSVQSAMARFRRAVGLDPEKPAKG